MSVLSLFFIKKAVALFIFDIFHYFTFVGFCATPMWVPSGLPEIYRVSKLVHIRKWFFVELD